MGDHAVEVVFNDGKNLRVSIKRDYRSAPVGRTDFLHF